jgi:CHAT domain-containing protein
MRSITSSRICASCSNKAALALAAIILLICADRTGAAFLVNAAPEVLPTAPQTQLRTTCQDVFNTQQIQAQRKSGDTLRYQESMLRAYNNAPGEACWTRAHIENELADYFQERGYYEPAADWDRRLAATLENCRNTVAAYDGFTNLSQFVGSDRKPDECSFVGEQWRYVEKYRNQPLELIRRSLAERELERKSAYSGNLLNPWEDDDEARRAALERKLERLTAQKDQLIRDFTSTDPLTKLRAAYNLAHVYHYSKLRDDTSAAYTAIYCLKETNETGSLPHKLNYRERLQLLYLLYHAHWNRGEYGEALKAIDYCLQGLAEHRKTFKDEDKSVEYFRNLEDVLSDKTLLLLYWKRVLSALAWLEDSKSPILKEIIAGKRKASRTEEQKELIETLENQNWYLEAVESVRGIGVRKRAASRPDDDNDENPFAGKAELIEDQSSIRLPVNGLEAGEIALTYFYHESAGAAESEAGARLYVIVYIAGQKPFALMRKVRPEAIENLVELFGEQVASYLETPNEIYSKIAQEALTKLYDGLMRSAIDDLERRAIKLKDQKLIIIPFGETANFPFHALYDRKSGKYLFERFKAIAYSPSLDLYLEGRENRIAKCDGILGLALTDFDKARTLTYTVKEVETIASYFQRPKLLRNQEATKARWKSLYANYPVLHFATHAIFNSERPKDSKILLYGNGIESNNLHAADLIDDDLKLDGKLVVLSACETGVQESRPGDDYFGIERYLFAARASAIVSSLWSVNDKATMDFMTEFYREFTGGCVAPSIAWRTAMLRTKEKHQNLFLWAPFKVTGY